MLKFRIKEDIRKFVGKYDEYSSLLNNYIEMGWKVSDKYDVSIEGGAYYSGK